MRDKLIRVGLFASLFLIMQPVLLPEITYGQTGEIAVPAPAPRAVQNRVSAPRKMDVEAESNEVEGEAKEICLAALGSIATVASTEAPVTDDAGCVVENPVSLTAVNGQSGGIRMPSDMLNKCSFALQLTHWLSDVVNPLAKQHLGSAIIAVRSGPGFVCRRRNNQPTGKLSEHAFGNAIDIAGFKLENGGSFNVKQADSLPPSEALFLDALRKTACGYFTTVLGPGSNPAHATHLHLDMGIHGKTNNYRICE